MQGIPNGGLVYENEKDDPNYGKKKGGAKGKKGALPSHVKTDAAGRIVLDKVSFDKQMKAKAREERLNK